MLPTPKQSWSHSTCSLSTLKDALNCSDDIITAIESDILMGTVIGPEQSSQLTSQPIMAHPPDNSSDLSFETFLELSINEKYELKKHLKLDIKEAECIKPILRTMHNHRIASNSPRIIYFNADILPGPAMRGSKCMNAPIFIEKCLQFIQEDGRPENYAFSLGWKTDCRSFFGYTQNDVAAMKELIEHYKLPQKCAGVVLAVNARVLAKRVDCLDGILEEVPSCQLLIWTGTGEPPISSGTFHYLEDHYSSNGYGERVGFDC